MSLKERFVSTLLLENLAGMQVSDLPADQQQALLNIRTDVSQLFATLSTEYMTRWRENCQNEDVLTDCPDIVKECVQNIAKAGLLKQSRFIPVESDYYHWELQQRAFRVNAPSASHMCKCVIMENTHCSHNNLDDPNYSRYYCVITQYITPVNTQKLVKYAQDLKGGQLSRKNYNFRLANQNVSLELTGFEKGGVCPIGMKQPIPIIMANDITKLEPPVIFLGAGHVDWKWGIPVKDFLEATQCMLADIN